VVAEPERIAGASLGRMEVVIKNGRRLIVDREVDLEVLLRVVRALEML
jgi:transposase